MRHLEGGFRIVAQSRCRNCRGDMSVMACMGTSERRVSTRFFYSHTQTRHGSTILFRVARGATANGKGMALRLPRQRPTKGDNVRRRSDTAGKDTGNAGIREHGTSSTSPEEEDGPSSPVYEIRGAQQRRLQRSQSALVGAVHTSSRPQPTRETRGLAMVGRRQANPGRASEPRPDSP